jgi:hypothetical protein
MPQTATIRDLIEAIHVNGAHGFFNRLAYRYNKRTEYLRVSLPVFEVVCDT